jgi:hypothetical protein
MTGWVRGVMWVHEALGMQEQSGGKKRLPAEKSPPFDRKATKETKIS